VLVELGDSRLVFGWVEFYSDFPNPPTLFLKDACWIDQKTSNRVQIPGPGILISGEFKSIGFHNAKDTRQSKPNADLKQVAPSANDPVH
jgi:hypothetical protein